METSLEASRAPSRAPQLFLRDRLVCKTLVFRWTRAGGDKRSDVSLTDTQWMVANKQTIQSLFAADRKRRELFHAFLARGCFGLFLVRDGEWISYGWSTRAGRESPPHLPYDIAKLRVQWIFHCHTREGFRGQGIYRRLLTRIVTLAQERDNCPIYIDVLPENVVSQRAILSTGFTHLGTLTTYKLWIPRLASLPLAGRWL